MIVAVGDPAGAVADRGELRTGCRYTPGPEAWQRELRSVPESMTAMAAERFAAAKYTLGRDPGGWTVMSAVAAGASARIGEAWAKRLTAGNWDLAIVARRRERLVAITQRLIERYGRAGDGAGLPAGPVRRHRDQPPQPMASGQPDPAIVSSQ